MSPLQQTLVGLGLACEGKDVRRGTSLNALDARVLATGALSALWFLLVLLDLAESGERPNQAVSTSSWRLPTSGTRQSFGVRASGEADRVCSCASDKWLCQTSRCNRAMRKARRQLPHFERPNHLCRGFLPLCAMGWDTLHPSPLRSLQVEIPRRSHASEAMTPGFSGNGCSSRGNSSANVDFKSMYARRSISPVRLQTAPCAVKRASPRTSANPGAVSAMKAHTPT
mmetsp:Transcript_61406/g.163357  ORF Transcript_61406/g.163357 Transcript_61406/m.163357 type:complete len:227 (+) Transcript_61406:654-1334(+)